MKKKWLLAMMTALCVGVCAFGLAACGESDEGGGTGSGNGSGNSSGNSSEHEHNFAQVWSHDATYHWHACTVEGCTQRSGTTAHIFGEDDICDVCEYERPATHKHTWEANFDEAQHWQETTCTEHEPEKQDEAAHIFEDGECECGVKQIYTEVYAVYKSYTESTEGNLLSYKAWLADLEEKNVEDVSLNQAGDAVLHYAPEGEDEEGTEEVAYFAERKVTAKAVRGGSTPYGPVWLKLTATVDGTTKTLATAQTTSQNNFEPEFAFTPTGYSSDTVTYAVAVMEDSEVPQTSGITVTAYPSSMKLMTESSVEFTVDEHGEEVCVATFNFEEALSLEHDYPEVQVSYNIGLVSVPVKLAPGGYLLTMTLSDDTTGSWKSGMAINNLAIRFNPYKSHNAQSNSVEYVVDAENQKVAYAYIYLNQSILKNAEEKFQFYRSLTSVYKFSLHIEPYTSPVVEGGQTINAAMLPADAAADDRVLGIDISRLKAGDYNLSLSQAAGCGTLQFNTSTLYAGWSYAIDNGGYSGMLTTAKQTITIGAGAKKLYLRTATPKSNTSSTYESKKLGARVISARFTPIIDTTGEEDITLYSGGEAVLHYTLPSAEKKAYEVTLTGTSLEGVKVTAPGASSAFIDNIKSSETAVTGCIWMEQGTASSALKEFTLASTGDGAKAVHIKIAPISATPTALTSSGDTFTFSEGLRVKLYSLTGAKNEIREFRISSADDISSIRVYKLVAASVTSSSGGLIIPSSVEERHSVSSYVGGWDSSYQDELIFAVVYAGDGKTYPSLTVQTGDPASRTSLTAGTLTRATVGGKDHGGVYYEFTAPAEGTYSLLLITADGEKFRKLTPTAQFVGTQSELMLYDWMEGVETVNNTNKAIENCDWKGRSFTATQANQKFIFFIFSPTGAENTFDILVLGAGGGTPVTAETDVTLGTGAEQSRVAVYTFTAEKSALHIIELKGTFEASAVSLLEGTSTTPVTLTDAGDVKFAVKYLEAEATYSFYFRLNGNTAATFKMKVIAPDEPQSITPEGSPLSVELSATSRYKFFTLSAPEGLNIEALTGDALGDVALYRNGDLVIDWGGGSPKDVIPAGSSYAYTLLYKGSASVTVSFGIDNGTNGLDLSEGPQKVTISPEKSIALFTYKNLKAGVYYIEVDMTGLDTNAFKKYKFYDGGDEISTATSSQANKAFYTTAVSKGYAYYRNKLEADGNVVFAISRGTTTGNGSVEFTVSLFSAQTAKQFEGTGHKETLSFGEGKPKYVPYAFKAEQEGMYVVAYTPVGADTLPKMTAYVENDAPTSTSNMFTSKDNITSSSTNPDKLFYSPFRLAAGETKVLFFQCAEEASVQVEWLAAPSSVDALQLESENSVTLNAENRVKFFTLTPASTGKYNLTVTSATEFVQYKLGLFVSTPEAVPATWLKVTSLLTSTGLTRTATNKDLENKTYTFCFVWTGEGELNLNVTFASSAT